jgi:hypothetical protein
MDIAFSLCVEEHVHVPKNGRHPPRLVVLLDRKIGLTRCPISSFKYVAAGDMHACRKMDKSINGYC